MMPRRSLAKFAVPLILALALSGCGVFGGKGGQIGRAHV